MNMHVELCGLRLRNPVLTASGTFGYGTEFEPYGDLKELGGITIKGVSLHPRQGNPMPRIVETGCSVPARPGDSRPSALPLSAGAVALGPAGATGGQGGGDDGEGDNEEGICNYQHSGYF